ncbi:NirD/YgiW/YdeI family stress tolerance protein [Roseospira goensis]|uniref:Uncharacterized protein YdeI (BOF family) n=1 Tax=Roseospira goensis TaxID=391922 RepID=A0A7W6S1L7_9PROT|nr:NirD/YgiW/YdeI family stress tolerance protein [Roseospira goensis]MBB4287051.1 uncharacterized protein YdeI (BOF family) [Roseospira goensis]
MLPTLARPWAIVAALTVTAGAVQAETVTPIGALQPGTVVTVQGTVERVTDEDEFRLADDSGRIEVYVGPNIVPARAGDRVTVRGIVDDDGPPEIYAREMVLPDGSVVRFPRSDE